MADVNNPQPAGVVNNSANSVVPPASNPKPASASPWEEELPEEPKKKPQVVGTLMPKKEIVNEPLKVPQNLEEKVGKKMPAENFVKGEGNTPAPIDLSSASGNMPPTVALSSNDPRITINERSKVPDELLAPNTNIPVPSTQPPQNQVLPQGQAVRGAGLSVFALFREKGLVFITIILVFFGISIALTELGLLSIGAEKVYGAIGVEKLWGGLSRDTSSALGKAFLQMSKSGNYKASGTITTTIDSNSTSSIVAPLADIISGEGTGSTNASALAEELPAVQAVEATFSLKTASDASEAEIILKSNNSLINLINKGADLYVKDTAGVYSGDQNMWLNVNIPTLESKVIQNDIFKADKSKGFAVSGERLGSGKIGGVKCFKYSIESAEIGNSLASFGITSEMAQSVTGTVWIGIRDKRIHQANLKIIPPISVSMRSINLEITFSDFGLPNTLSTISESDILFSKKEPVTETPIATADQTRKQDVDNILLALKSYKDKMGYYPVSSVLLKLNITDNAIYRALVPTYVTTFPQDPKAADGWYYAYKSDGIKCSVSARLENQNDAEGVTSNGVLLYLKYNND